MFLFPLQRHRSVSVGNKWMELRDTPQQPTVFCGRFTLSLLLSCPRVHESHVVPDSEGVLQLFSLVAVVFPFFFATPR